MKKYVSLVTAFAVICVTLAADEKVSEEKTMAPLKSFETFNVVPDVVSVAPSALLKISYPTNVSVSEGNELTPTSVKDQPTLEWAADKDAFYTVCMTDPDAPSPKNPIRREWLHWLVVNIPGSDIAKGVVLAEFLGSGPPKDTGLHRYVTIVYKQPAKIEFSETPINDTTATGRPNFSNDKFAKKYSLGSPVAGNFYKSQYDDYVPTLHKQIQTNKKP